MRYLIDIGHPAHFHYFKNLAEIFVGKGHSVLFTCRDKEVTVNLLSNSGFQYQVMGTPFKSAPGKIWGIFWFTFKLIRISMKFKPDVFLNATNYSALASWIMRKYHISIEDSFNMEQVRLYLPFTNAVLTAKYPHPDLGKKNFRYDGYQELAYLHPNRYHPDPGIFDLLHLKKGEKYIILRFVSWNASHDINQKGLSLEYALNLILHLEKFARIFISSEKKLPPEFEKYAIKIPPEKMHDALSFASLFIGEGTTMASESAVLGTPAIYVNSISRPYTTEQEEKYGLVFNFRNQEGVLEKALEIINIENVKDIWQIKRQKMLSEKIDVTAFFCWFIENFPKSAAIMKENPDYHYNFK